MNRHAIACLCCILMLSAMLITAGCTAPQDAVPDPAGAQIPAAIGDTVRVHYTGTLDDGQMFDSSRDREPLQFTLGAGSMLPEFEAAIIGMSPGDSKKFTILSANAYGPRTIELDRNRIALQEEPQIGQLLRMVTEQGRVMEVEIAAMDDETVTVENTHPLAGENLTFSVTLVEFVDEA
jgi:peptidylprolyl isomerase